MNAQGGQIPLFEAINVIKAFGNFRANDGVSLRVMPGEIHAFLGENGAGKSTLVKMIYGVMQPTAGQFMWQGKEIVVASPAVARSLGIGMVFQHFSLFEALSVAENIALAIQGRFDITELSTRIREVSSEYGLPLNPSAKIIDLSVGERQRVEIVRCLLQHPRLLIMDEPTSVLTPQESNQLFVVLRRLAKEGCAILYISHRLEEVRDLCTTATILRHGKVVATVDPRKESAGSLARLMVGSDIHVVKPKEADNTGPVRLALTGMTLHSDRQFATSLSNINLEVHAGEVVAIAGVAGNGQGELFDGISGETKSPSSDMVKIDDVAVGHSGINARRQRGASFVVEERLGHGSVPSLPLSKNVVLTRHPIDRSIAAYGILSLKAAATALKRIVDAFDVRMSKTDPEAKALSGGNLQKFVIGRELDRKPGILVVNQPTWGVDAGASAAIRQAMVNLARSGTAVLIISQDLDEIFEIADRIAVISRGQLSSALPASEYNREKIGLLMAGSHENKGNHNAVPA
jgi:general nucleoside transport system ATP-binding protein